MSKPSNLFLAAALAGLAATSVQASDSCEWRAPGSAAYAGDVAAAVDDYTDMPAPARERLKARMRSLSYDDMVVIRREGIDGGASYEPGLRGLHLEGRLCGEVTRASWHPEHEERALAYCEGAHCVVVSLIYRNVGRIVRKPGNTASGVPGAPVGALAFDPPAAGLQPQAAAADEADPTANSLMAPPTVSRIAAATDLPLASPLVQALPPVVDMPMPMPMPSFAPELPLAPEPAPPDVWQAPAMPPLPPAPAVPEPATALLWAAGLVAGALWARRRKPATH